MPDPGTVSLNHNNANKYRAGVPPFSCQFPTGNSPGLGLTAKGGRSGVGTAEIESGQA